MYQISGWGRGVVDDATCWVLLGDPLWPSPVPEGWTTGEWWGTGSLKHFTQLAYVVA